MLLKLNLVGMFGVMVGFLNGCSEITPSTNNDNQKSDGGTSSATIAKTSSNPKGTDAGRPKVPDAQRSVDIEAGRNDSLSIKLDSGLPERSAIDTQKVQPICVPETDTQFCQRHGKTCGNYSALDNCSQNRSSVNCGTCPNQETCDKEICTSQGSVSRPSTNTGTGFYVANGKLYDPKGNEFRIRGVNKCHYDAEWPGIPKTHSNTIRWVAPVWNSSHLETIIKDSITEKIVPMPGVWFTSDAWSDEENVTCKDDPKQLKRAVDLWVARASMMKSYEKHVLVNIANEWGPADSTIWRDSYIEAVSRMRAAGYLGTLVIDSGGCGQDPLDIIKYGQAVFASDPQRNILFDVHIYGEWANGKGKSWQIDLKTNFDRLASLKLPIIIGEFGPGRDIGPSPTQMTPGEIITASEAREFGWLAWAWDDPAWGGDDDSFTMSFNRDYNKSSDLTIFGKDVVENPVYGLLKLARPAASF